ncbi:FUSC family protein [Aurantimonas sp. Leaf443]|uniref:FUSC family protein n=1 Tax=Aurantimonas sp. Leaf443 TaxID=1736378 RepID=UPI000700FCB0|nr:FUSC family protein [Aurantimonas sp. Leaf443]KQT85945.1 hypothetical protein ASG48_04935 [Aurantimonas sp. Leaf443]
MPPVALLRRLAASFVVSDPGLTRLRMAARTVLTLAAVVLSLVIVHPVLPLPVAAYGVAMTTALQGALQIRDATRRARLVTRAWCALAGFASVALASLLAATAFTHPVFLGIVFLAVWARRFGQRWNAAGMYGFMCYFIGAYLHPAVADLGAIALAIVLSAIVAHLVRNHVLPEDPERDFRVALVAVDANRRAFEAAMRRLERASPPGKDRPSRREAARAEERLKDAILTAEGLLPGEAGTPQADALRREMVVALFDLQLAAEARFFAGAPDVGGQGDDAPERHREAAARRLDEAAMRVAEAARTLPAGAFEGSPGAAPARGPTKGAGLLADPALRLAIQVTLAAAIAMAGGLVLSPTRWFWAILTAFLVFTNAQSRGDTMQRGLGRAAGTLAGITVGMGLATLLGGALAPSVALIAIFVFVAFYLLQVSYAAMTFFMTLAISVLYGLIGQFTPALLVLRLEETVIGAAAGIFIAFVVFPRTTGTVIDEAVAAFLDAFDELLAAAIERVEDRRRHGLIRLSRGLDRRYLDLAVAARPLGGDWQLVRKPGRVRTALIRFRSAAYWAHVLARGLGRARIEPEDRPALRAEIEALRARIATLRTRRDAFFGTAIRSLDETPRPDPDRLEMGESRDDPRFALAVIARILDRSVPEAEAGPQPGTGVPTADAGV